MTNIKRNICQSKCEIFKILQLGLGLGSMHFESDGDIGLEVDICHLNEFNAIGH